MTLESEPIRHRNETVNASRESESQANQGNPHVPITPRVPASQPPKTHCEITCKTEKGFWDHVKTGAEILGIVLLAVYTAFTIKIACASKRAAEAAADAVTLARDNAHLDQRAWLAVTSVRLTVPYSTESAGQITVALANSGKTPALDAGITKDSFGDFDNPILSSPGAIDRMTVAPATTSDTLFLSVPPTNQKSKVYIRFVIEYWDIFQKRGIDPPHATVFCGYYPTTQPPFFFNTSGCGAMN
jgi:hypothetical protein